MSKDFRSDVCKCVWKCYRKCENYFFLFVCIYTLFIIIPSFSCLYFLCLLYASLKLSIFSFLRKGFLTELQKLLMLSTTQPRGQLIKGSRIYFIAICIILLQMNYIYLYIYMYIIPHYTIQTIRHLNLQTFLF